MAEQVEKEPSIVTALVPAAGRGTRMGGLRKQYRTLAGEPLILHTLRRLAACEAVHHLVVSAPAGEIAPMEDLVAGLRKVCAVVEGGQTRQASVAASLAAAPPNTDIILVHDGVRPFVSVDRIDAVISEARRVGAAALAIAVADTLRRGTDDVFGPAVDRAGLYRMQTPQAFRREWFEEAHRAAEEEGRIETDDVALVQHLGWPVAMVNGRSTNIKVTTPEDWAHAEMLWNIEQKTRSGEA